MTNFMIIQNSALYLVKGRWSGPEGGDHVPRQHTQHRLLRTAFAMLICFCLRIYFCDLSGTCPRLMLFLTSPLMWFDLLAMLPTFCELILQERAMKHNLRLSFIYF